MYSITDYSKGLEKALELLASLNPLYKKQRPLTTAFKIVNKSVTLELPSNPLEVKSIDEQMTAMDKDIGPLVAFHLEKYNKTKEYPVPDISDKFGLLFAILFYKHLCNYKHVEYQGNVPNYWPLYLRDLVNNRITERQAYAVLQAAALREKILLFCSEHQFALNENDLAEESSPEKTLALIKTLYHRIEQCEAISDVSEVEEAPSQAPSSTPVTSDYLITRKQYLQKQNQFSQFVDGLLTLGFKSQAYTKALVEDQSQSLLLRCIYFLISWFYIPSNQQKISHARAELNQAQQNLDEMSTGAHSTNHHYQQLTSAYLTLSFEHHIEELHYSSIKPASSLSFFKPQEASMGEPEEEMVCQSTPSL